MRRRRRDDIAKAVDEASLSFQLYASGAELLKNDDSTSSALQKHLLRSLGQSIADLLLRHHEVLLSSSRGQKPIREFPSSQAYSDAPSNIA